LIEMVAKFRIVTPLFMSGSERSQAELREASIKGVLRFWWRALALGRLKSVEEVKKEKTRFSVARKQDNQTYSLCCHCPKD